MYRFTTHKKHEQHVFDTFHDDHTSTCNYQVSSTHTCNSELLQVQKEKKSQNQLKT